MLQNLMRFLNLTQKYRVCLDIQHLIDININPHKTQININFIYSNTPYCVAMFKSHN